MNPICNSVHVRVPATSANLGSGFDTVGLALDYHDELTFTLNDDPNDGIAHVIIHGEGADALPCDETHLVVSTFRRACATFGLGRLGFTLEATNNIPQARGMGSSAEAIVAGIAAEFAKNGVSINGVNQDLKPTMTDPGYDGEIQQLRIVTHLTDEETLRNTVKAVQALDFVTGDPSILRVLD